MHSNPLHSMLPLERYRYLIGALASENDAWDESFWLRFAAQAAVLCPEPPLVLAKRIRAVADELLKQTLWYQTLAGPARFVVAAMLIQHHISVTDFITEHTHASALMNDAGLRHDRFYEIMAVLILMMAPNHRLTSLLEIERVKAIYDQMKGFHWWLTGPDDLPACTALAQCPGTAEVLVARVEDAYQELLGAGLPTGEHLQTMANLLPLAGLNMDETVKRFCGLTTILKRHMSPLTADHHLPLALLTLLDHDPELVIERLLVAIKELDLFQAEAQGAVNFHIAADLTFLDLVRFDHQQPPLTQRRAPADLQRSLHAYHLGSAVLVSQVDPNLFQFMSATGLTQWPYFPPFI